MPASLSGEPTVTIICAQVAQPSYGGIPTQTVRYNKLFPCLRIMTPMLTARTTEDNIVPNRHLLSSTQCRPISHFEDNYYLKNKPQQHQCDDGVPNERLVSDLGYIPQSAIQIDDL
jgi:hypothetical protein